MRIIAYVYEADYHCVPCAVERFGSPDNAIDDEGNPVHPVFETDEIHPDEVCGTCGEFIGEDTFIAES